MATSCKFKQEAVKLVLDKFYGGQERFFEKNLSTSVSDDQNSWHVTVYQVSLFGTITMTTYMVDKDKRITKRVAWINQH